MEKKAALIAEILGESSAQFVRLALQGSFDFAGLDIIVEKITDTRLKKALEFGTNPMSVLE